MPIHDHFFGSDFGP